MTQKPFFGFAAWLGKQAGDLLKITSRSRRVPVKDGKVQEALQEEPPPASHQQPTRYGRKFAKEP